jgi:hypothetical protein
MIYFTRGIICRKIGGMVRKRGYWFAGFQHRFKHWRVLGWVAVSAPVGVLVAALAFRDWLSPEDRVWMHLQYLPSVKMYWPYYLIGVLAYFLLVLLFVVPAANQVTLAAAVAAEREHAKKKIERYQRMRQSQTQPPPLPSGVMAESNIEPYAMETVGAYKDEHGFMIERSADDATLRALVIPYKNNRHHRSLRRVGDIDNVSAEISWVSWDGSGFNLRAGPAAWLSETKEKLSFGRDDQPNRLVLATTGMSDYSNLCAAQRQTATLSKAIREIPLIGSCWRVRINLHAESEPKPVAHYDLILDKDFFGSKPELVGIGVWKDIRVTKLQLAAWEFLKRVRSGEDITAEYEMWQTETAAFIGRNYEEKPKSKFLFEKRGGTGRFSPPRPKQPVTLEERIKRQLETLDELAKKNA